MARREYRSPTGKLLGYSQSETDRTGGNGLIGKLVAYILLAIIGIGLLRHWLGF